MVKVALLIGVSEYAESLDPLPAAAKDVQAMLQVLQHPEMGGFDEVNTLVNPDITAMQQAIETLFSDRNRDDLVLLFFSGHGVKDDSGKLYFATHITSKNRFKSTAVPASFVQSIMSDSSSRRQVAILDCCFSGAFAVGLSAKDNGSVDIKNQLGGEGRVVLTSSTSTQYSYEQQGYDLSIYTRYIIEGIKTGAADRDEDGMISVYELHEYAKEKVQEAAPTMKPEIYAVKEGFTILLSKAAIDDPKLVYRKLAQKLARRGKFSSVERQILDWQRGELRLPPEDADAIEAEVVQPYRDYQQKLEKYQHAFVDAIKQEYPLSDDTRNTLKHFQQILKLTDDDVARIEAIIISGKDQSPEAQDQSLAKTAQLRWSESGSLVYSERIIPVQRADVNLRDFIVEAKFYNPYDLAIGAWEYGFSFRETTKFFEDPQRQTYDLYINSNSKTAKLTGPRTHVMVNVSNLDVSDNGSNQLRLTVTGNKAMLFVNDIYIDTFDVSTLMTSGSVYVVSKGKSGNSVKYENFKIWSIGD